MKLYRAIITKKDLNKMSLDEQVCFVQAGRFINEISLFNKLIDFSRRGPEGDIELKARNSQTLSLLLILIGKLNECFLFIKKAFSLIKAREKREVLFSEDALEAYEKLKKYFSKGNLINNIRKKIAFHHDGEIIKDQLLKMKDEESFEIYFHDTVGNCLYHISNQIILRDMLDRVDSKNHEGAFKKLLLEVYGTSNLFIDFLNDLMGIFAEIHGKHFPPLEEIEIPDPQSIDDIQLPYFVGKQKEIG